jgi:hypothetical protein
MFGPFNRRPMCETIAQRDALAKPLSAIKWRETTTIRPNEQFSRSEMPGRRGIRQMRTHQAECSSSLIFKKTGPICFSGFQIAWRQMANRKFVAAAKWQA